MIEPYYTDEYVTLYHGNCLDVLPQLEVVDLVVTDPPYGVGLTRKTSDYRDSKYWDNGKSLEASVKYEDSPEVIAKLLREVMPLILSKSHRSIIFSGTAMLWEYPTPHAVGCVYLPAGAGRCTWGFQCFQPILFYGKDPYMATGKGGRPNSFKTEQPNLEKIDHPCPKPLSWMKWAIQRGSVSATDVILDPFVGSGTTLRAAKDLGLKSIGIEVEEKYCEIAVKRLRQEVLWLAMDS